MKSIKKFDNFDSLKSEDIRKDASEEQINSLLKEMHDFYSNLKSTTK